MTPTSEPGPSVEDRPQHTGKVDKEYHETELLRAQVELVTQQEYIRAGGSR